MRTLIVILVALAVACPFAMAVPVVVTSQDTPSQDPLIPHVDVHELGKPSFPPNELITASNVMTFYSPCRQNPDTPTPNFEVTIVNLTSVPWTELVYVADPETTLTNDDGIVNGELAFNIDWVGLNTPLVFESFVADTIFAPGETWKFVIQDYFNVAGVSPSAFGSVGLVGVPSGGDTFSSGPTLFGRSEDLIVWLGVGLADYASDILGPSDFCFNRVTYRLIKAFRIETSFFRFYFEPLPGFWEIMFRSGHIITPVRKL